MFNALFGYLQELCERPIEVLRPMAMVDVKEDGDVDSATTGIDVNVVDGVHIRSAFEQCPDRAVHHVCR